MPGKSVPARLPFVGEDGILPAVSRPQPGRPSRLVYTRSVTDSKIWRFQTATVGVAAASPPAVAVSSTSLDVNVQLSPDDRRVAFCSDRSGDMEIRLADPDGANAQLTSMGAVTTCTWSPDGHLVAFDSNPEGHYEIYVAPASGARSGCVTIDRANDNVPSFSRDGKWIYFSSNRGGEYQIWKVPIPGGERFRSRTMAASWLSSRPMTPTCTTRSLSFAQRLVAAAGLRRPACPAISLRAASWRSNKVYTIFTRREAKPS
jgi:WD40 repeat protein